MNTLETMTDKQSVFLSGPHPPDLVARGLYAGLKSRGGLPTPLPLQLSKDFYVNAGFIDGLSTILTRLLKSSDLQIRIIAKGPVLLEWYYLDRDGAIRHYTDHPTAVSDLGAAARHDLPVPNLLLNDDNVSLIFFRISHHSECKLTDSSELIDWCFHAKHSHADLQRPLMLVSRSHGESERLIEQHHNYQLHLRDLRQRFPDLLLMPIPILHLYESDSDAYQRSTQRLKMFSEAHPGLQSTVILHRNHVNLGGGGNMCLAIKKSIVDSDYEDDFIMIDSDTLVPFKTLYSCALITGLTSATTDKSTVLSPVVAYRRRPTQVLEAGCLFGRGAWQLAVAEPLRPCIFSMEHGADLSDKHVQARLSQPQSSDYPPFIFSFLRLGGLTPQHSRLPVPFFLRGDDVEYGIHLRNHGIETSVAGFLVVFQDPKHSPWHEVMAILHSIVILIAYASKPGLNQLSEHLHAFFQDRLDAHASARDLHGIAIYQQVLSRLLSILSIPTESLHSHFYDPSYYLQLRNLNTPYTSLNYALSRKIAEAMPKHVYRELPFVHYPVLPDDEPLPSSIFLLNHLAETAAVLHPNQVSYSELLAARLQFQRDLSILIASLASLGDRCQTLLDRSQIDHAYALYSPAKASHKKEADPSNSKQP